jgi:hypothetical protein
MNSIPNELDPSQETALSAAIIALLRGVVYEENDRILWERLIRLDAKIRDYVRVLDLDLVIDEAEGYAFLRSRPEEHTSAPHAPVARLVPRRPLSFPVSLLLALLRKKLAEFDASGSETRLVLTREEIVEMLRLFLPQHTNEARLADQTEAHLNKIADLGFIRRLKTQPGSTQPPTFEIRRILKAFVDAQWLANFDARLDEYRRSLEIPEDSTNA